MDTVPLPAMPWYRSTFFVALVGALLLWAALPPLALGWLGWIAPVPWLWLIAEHSLAGRRPYRTLYLAGLVFWLLTIHWLRLPHPAVYLGWFALSAYLAVYLPIFVALSRVAVHRLGVPLWIAAPVVWTGLELARAHLLTGFMMGALAHTQVEWIRLIQISDLFGEYGVDFVVMMVAACIASAVRYSPQTEVPKKLSFYPAAFIPGTVVLAVTLAYGTMRLDEAAETRDDSRPAIRIALIQGNSLADWKSDAGKQRQIMEEYIGLSKRAADEAKTNGGRPLDLIVWPETMYRTPLREFEAGYELPGGINETTESIVASDKRQLADLVKYLDTPVLVGIDRVQFLKHAPGEDGGPAYKAYNSAVLVDKRGEIVGTYDKYHLVMFGEYVPFAGWFPVLNRLSSLTGSVLAGEGPVSLCTNGVCYSPSICYETVIPHVMRQSPESTDVLVNMTNDAWYWGSSELDQHLACGVFRAIESRKPLVIAANGGLSAWIDHAGNVKAKSTRQQPDIIVADVKRSPMRPLYRRIGEAFAGLCLTACVALAMIGYFTRPNSHP